MRYLVFIIALFAALQTNAQNNIVYGAGINYTNGAPTFTPPVRTSRVAIDTVTGRWYHFNTPGGWQWIGNTVEEIAGCTAPAYTPGKGDSKVVINNCSPQPELYFYNGSAWVLVGGGSVYAGEGIRIENDTIILDSLNFLDFRTGSALDGDVGRVQWNDTDGTLDLNLKGGNVTLQIGQEEVSLVKHADNSGLIEGRVVYIVGSDGANKTVRYALADSDLTSATTFGLMTESATGGNKAFCTTFGLVRNLNTTNLTEGGIVWLSADTAGQMTAVRPTAPDHGVMIGFCVRKHATQGAIFVQVQNGYELNELHDVFAPSPTNGQVLTWNSTNARWEAIAPANQLQTLSTNNTPGNISISSGNTITLNVNDADASATNELQTLSVAANTTTLSNSGGSVTIAGAGINTVGTAGTTITVTGTEVDGSTANELQTLSTGTNTLTLSNGGGTVTVDTNPADDVTGSGTSGQVSFWTAAQTQGGDNGLFWNNIDKRLGIGTNAPGSTMQINGSGNTSASSSLAILNSDNSVLFNARNDGSISFGNSGANAPYIAAYTNATPFGATARTLALIYTATVGTRPIPAILATGTQALTYTANEGVLFQIPQSFAPTSGTGSISLFNINSTINQTGGANGISRGIRINPTLTSAADWRSIEWANNAGWGLYGLGTAPNYLAGSTSIGSTSTPARLHVVGSGTTTGTWTAQFHNSGGSNNALMIRDDGRVAMGTNAPNASAILTVTSTTGGILFPRMTTTERNAIATPADGLVIYNTTDNKLQVRAGGAWVDLH